MEPKSSDIGSNAAHGDNRTEWHMVTERIDTSRVCSRQGKKRRYRGISAFIRKAHHDFAQHSANDTNCTRSMRRFGLAPYTLTSPNFEDVHARWSPYYIVDTWLFLLNPNPNPNLDPTQTENNGWGDTLYAMGEVCVCRAQSGAALSGAPGTVSPQKIRVR